MYRPLPHTLTYSHVLVMYTVNCSLFAGEQASLCMICMLLSCRVTCIVPLLRHSPHVPSLCCSVQGRHPRTRAGLSASTMSLDFRTPVGSSRGVCVHCAHVRLCMHVCVCACMCAFVHACVYVHVCTCGFVHACVCACVGVCGTVVDCEPHPITQWGMMWCMCTYVCIYSVCVHCTVHTVIGKLCCTISSSKTLDGTKDQVSTNDLLVWSSPAGW